MIPIIQHGTPKLVLYVFPVHQGLCWVGWVGDEKLTVTDAFLSAAQVPREYWPPQEFIVQMKDPK